MTAAGWVLLVAGLLAHAAARRRDNALLDELAEEVAIRHEQVSRAQIGGFAVALAVFFLLGRGPAALSVTLAMMGAGALGAAMWRAQLPGPEGIRVWLVAELLASWGLYLGVALVLWG